MCGGRPVIAGTRIRVLDILDMLADGTSLAEIVTDFTYVMVDDVRACVRFPAALPIIRWSRRPSRISGRRTTAAGTKPLAGDPGHDAMPVSNAGLPTYPRSTRPPNSRGRCD